MGLAWRAVPGASAQQHAGRRTTPGENDHMGIINFVKQGVQEMCIARPDAMKNLLVYKHPDETIPWKAFLTVAADECAVFFKDGRVQGVVQPGRVNLDSNNIPFLSNLIDKFTGGNVLKSWVFFITLKPIYDVPVGGALGMMEDPLLGEAVEPRFFGKIAVQIVDPPRFLLNYVGTRATTAEEQIAWIRGVFMNSVKVVVGRVCIDQQKSMLQLMSLQNEIKQAFMQNAPDLNNIGVRVVDVGEFSINLSEEDKQTLKSAQAEIGEAKRAARKAQIAIGTAAAEAQQREFKLQQDLQYRAQYANLAAQNPGYMMAAQADAVRGAGDGMAKGGAGVGVAGLGAQMAVGVGMAGMFQQGMVVPQQVQRVQPPAGGALNCAKCGLASSGGKFCANCGTPLAPPAPQPAFCANCGLPVQGKFCQNCGTPMGAAPAAGGAPGAPPMAGPAGMPGGAAAPMAAPGYPPAGAVPQGYPPAQPGYPPQAQVPQPGYPQAPPQAGGYGGGVPQQGYPPAGIPGPAGG